MTRMRGFKDRQQPKEGWFLLTHHRPVNERASICVNIPIECYNYWPSIGNHYNSL